MFVDNDGERVWRGQVGRAGGAERERKKREEHAAEREGRGKLLRATEVEAKVGEGRRVEGKERI